MKRNTLTIILAMTLTVSLLVGCAREGNAPLLDDSAGAPTDYAQSAAAASTGASWDLTKLFVDAAAYDAECDRITTELLPDYEEKARNLEDAEDIKAWLQAYDGMCAALDKLTSYSLCAYYRDGSNNQALAQYNTAYALQQQFALLTSAAEETLSTKDKAYFASLMDNADLQPWQRHLAYIQNIIPHTLTEEQTLLLQPSFLAMNQMSTLSSTLLDTDLQYRTFTDANGVELEADYVNNAAAQRSADRDLRERAHTAFSATLLDYSNTFAGIYDAFVKLAESTADIYHYDNSLDQAMQGYELTAEDFTALVDSARQHSGLEARYNALRQAALGVDELQRWDVNVSLCEAPDIVYTFADAKELILTALAPLGGEYLAYVERIFDEGRIDADPGENKFSGSLCNIGYELDPLILTNFTGDYYSVTALAHELGHAVHNLYINDYQQSCYNSNPTMLSTEVAAITNELLLTRYMQHNAKTEQEKLYYLLYELDAFRLNYFTGLARASFEDDMHRIVQDGGTLTGQVLNEAYCKSLDEFSPGIVTTNNVNAGWTYINQLYAPYYNCAYSFATAAACSAAQGVLDGSGTGDYLAFLAAGDSLPAKELFALTGASLGSAGYSQLLYDRYAEILDIAEELLP